MITPAYNFTKISQIKLQKYGKRGFSLSIPNVYVKDRQLEHGDIFNIYRTLLNGEDVLILMPTSTIKDNTTQSNCQENNTTGN